MPRKKLSIFDRAILRQAALDAFEKLDPRTLVKNPVMFVCEVGALITTTDLILGGRRAGASFIAQVSAWLWFTVLFANFAEALAEGRGKAQANTLKKMRTETIAHRLGPGRSSREDVPAHQLRRGDEVQVAAGELIPTDGEVIEGMAAVDESAMTGESEPVIRAAGGDRSSVTGGTKVISDELVIRVTADPGESFLDHMIRLVEGAYRHKTPNEIALSILLSGLTIIFVAVVLSLRFFAAHAGVPVSVPVLVALLVCLIPTTIGGLLSAIGIAGIDRLVQHNVLAMSGRAVEAAGDIDVLLLDKTGTITMGDRQAIELVPAEGVAAPRLAEAARLASLADETPEGKSIVALTSKQGAATPGAAELRAAAFVPFHAETRMSGVDIDGRRIRKGAYEAIKALCGGRLPASVERAVERIATSGGTPLVVAEDGEAIGVVHLKDIVKAGLPERFERFRAMGIKTVMITGDHRLTAAAIAAEAGTDDFLAEASPETKLALIRREQAEGHLVAMTGDGTNDAPALAQADVGVAMNTGTQAAKEAGNMVDLDSDPTKLIEIVEIGKQMLMTRGALTTFSVANDVAKYFAIIPAILIGTFPEMSPLDVMGLRSPETAVLSAVIFNALIIVALIPLALRGVRFRPLGAAELLRRNFFIYGVGGLGVPFVGIKLISVVVAALHLV